MHQQVVEFGEFTNDFHHGSIGVNSNVSVSSSEDNDNSSNSSQSNESNSPKVVNNKHRFTNNIIQHIFESDDNNEHN